MVERAGVNQKSANLRNPKKTCRSKKTESRITASLNFVSHILILFTLDYQWRYDHEVNGTSVYDGTALQNYNVSSDLLSTPDLIRVCLFNRFLYPGMSSGRRFGDVFDQHNCSNNELGTILGPIFASNSDNDGVSMAEKVLAQSHLGYTGKNTSRLYESELISFCATSQSHFSYYIGMEKCIVLSYLMIITIMNNPHIPLI